MIIIGKQDTMREMTLKWISSNEKYIIELGCSNGNFAKLLNDKEIKNYLGIDIQKDKIEDAKKKLRNMNFLCCDITTSLYILKEASLFISFQCLEHIEKDLDIIQSLKEGTRLIISVPNRKYKGHIRWFELDGWKNRFSPYIDIDTEITIQHPIKSKNRAFLFKGVRI